MTRDQLKAMIKSLHGTRDQYGRLAQKAEESRRQQRNEGSSERDRYEMGQTMCTVLIVAYEAALAVTAPTPQPISGGKNPVAWRWRFNDSDKWFAGTTVPEKPSWSLNEIVELQPLYGSDDGTLDACARLIEENIIMDTGAGKILAPRQEGNRDGLHYAVAIRALLTAKDGSNETL